MEHLVSFTVSLDDDHIEELVLKSAVKEITKELTKKVEKIIYKRDTWSGDDLSQDVCNTIRDFMEINREDIINRAAGKLAESLKRTKAVKEKVEEIVAQI